MINPVSLIVAAVFAVRLINAVRKGKVQTGQAFPTLKSGWLLLLYVLFVGPWFIVGVVHAIVEPTVTTFAEIAVAVPVVWPWFTVRWLCVPFGSPRLAWFVAKCMPWGWNRDRLGGPVAAGAWANLRRGQHRAVWADAAEVRLKRGPLRGGGILASGLIAAGRGDRATARSMLGSLRRVHRKVCPRLAVALGREWLMLDAVERSEWREVLEIGSWEGAAMTSLSRLLFGIAAELEGKPYRFGPLRRGFWWLLAGRWHTTWSLLSTTIGRASMPREVQPAPRVSFESPIGLAMTFHGQVLRSGPLTADRLIAAGHAWDAALNDLALQQRISARSVALADPTPNDALQRLRTTAVDDLVAAVRDRDLPLDGWRNESEILGLVASAVREDLLSEVSELSRRLGERVTAERALPTVDEWREALTLMRAHERAGLRGGLEARRLAFAESYHPLSSLAVWLYNKRNEKAVGNAIIVWMRDEALAVGDQAALLLQEKNARLGPGP